MLTVKALHKSYQVGKTTYEVLKGVSLTVEKGEFEEKLRGAAERVGHEVEIVFDGGYVDDPGLFNPDSETRRRDRYTLVFRPEDGSFRVARAKREAMCLKFLNKVHTPAEFREAMRTLAQE